MKEIFNRGPISCGIDANPLLKYTTGIAKGWSLMQAHVSKHSRPQDFTLEKA